MPPNAFICRQCGCDLDKSQFCDCRKDEPNIKKFKLEDLHGRTLKVMKTQSVEGSEKTIIVLAFDVNTGDSFLLDSYTVPLTLVSNQ